MWTSLSDSHLPTARPLHAVVDLDKLFSFSLQIYVLTQHRQKNRSQKNDLDTQLFEGDFSLNFREEKKLGKKNPNKIKIK